MDQNSAADTQLADGWPLPPHWYKYFPGDIPIDDSIPDVNYEQFPPPAIPEGNVTAFGAIVDMNEENESSNIMGTEDIMFDPDSDLSEEFSRLFELFLEEVTVLFGQSAQTGNEFSSGATGRCKNIIKVYKNLQNILQMLRQRQFLRDVQKRLEDQYNHKLQIINDIRQLAFNLPPITGDSEDEDILWMSLVFNVLLTKGDISEEFAKYQSDVINEYLPSLPVYMKVYGSIFQTAYYFIDIFLGAPHPHEYSMIIDTGSSTQGLPCSNCRSCGNQHWEQPYDLANSKFNEKVPCGNCSTCRLNTDKQTLKKIAAPLTEVSDPHEFSAEASKLLLNNPDVMQCLYNVHYAEGSRLQGIFYMDVLWLNMDKAKNKSLQIRQSKKAHDDSCPSFPVQAGPSVPLRVPVGCHVEETHLFHDQKASGILGLEFWGTRGITTFPTSILSSLKTLYERPQSKIVTCDDVEGNAEVLDQFKYLFSLCLSPKGGSLSFGGTNDVYHAAGGSSKSIPLLSHPWRSQSYTIGMTNVAVMKNATLTPSLHSEEYFALLKNSSMWHEIPLKHSSTVIEPNKSTRIIPTLVDSGTTLSYMPPRLFGELLFDIENRVAINTGIRDRQKLMRSPTRSLERVEPALLFSSPDANVVIRDRFMAKSEKANPNDLDFIPVSTALMSTGPKRLVRVSAVSTDTTSRNLQNYIERELEKRMPDSPGRRRLQDGRSPGWYAVLEPSVDPANEPLDALVGFLDIPERMEAAAPRALISKLDGYNNGECWWLQDPVKDLPLFPILQFTFLPDQKLFWHPTSYLYSGSNRHFWCLAIMTDASRGPTDNSVDTEAIFGSNSFINHDVTFKLKQPPMDETAEDHVVYDNHQTVEYRLHPTAEIGYAESDCPIIPIEK